MCFNNDNVPRVKFRAILFRKNELSVTVADVRGNDFGLMKIELRYQRGMAAERIKQMRCLPMACLGVRKEQCNREITIKIGVLNGR